MTVGTMFMLLIILGISASCYYVIWRVFRVERRISDAFEDRIFRRGSKETDIEKTAAARLNIENLPAHMDFIAGFGKQDSAPETGDEKILRPTMGLRFISGLLGAALLLMIWFGPAEYTGGSLTIKFGITAVLAYVTAYTQLYELRYDREGFTHQGYLFRPRRYLWRDLASIKDNGHYAYVLQMKNRRKVEVQKYLVGIPAFLALAKDHIVQNNLR